MSCSKFYSELKVLKVFLFPLFIGIALIGLSVWARVEGLYFESQDIKGYVAPWYEFLAGKGIRNGLGSNFSNYTPPYLYFLALATRTKPFLDRIIAIKIIGMLFDIYAAIISGIIVFQKYKRVEIGFLAGSVYFALPTVWLNSTVWGQVDGIYSAFILTSLLFFLKDRPQIAMIFFGIAFSFKLQAIFFTPFLLVLFLKGRLKWHSFLIIPITYIFMMLPAAVLGRSWNEMAFIYPMQMRESGDQKIWSRNGQNIFAFLPSSFPTSLSNYFTILAGIIVLAWVYFTYRKCKTNDQSEMLLVSLVCVMIVPSVLPFMHERYFFLAEILSFVLAFYIPRLWLLPVALQAGTFLVYSNFLFPNEVYDETRLYGAVIINLMLLFYLLSYQFGYFRKLQADG